ncbi:hypothetical protein NIES4101_53890 [Calothrix sp. NIES-4101]|nr:hypothetical protein NIES4101_53890 [Calothrix sp. NIES-4101]
MGTVKLKRMKINELALTATATVASGALLWLCQMGYSGLERLARIEEQTKAISEKIAKTERDSSNLQAQMTGIEVRLRSLELERETGRR